MNKLAKLLPILFLALTFYHSLFISSSYAAVPRLINYQGKLTNPKGEQPLADGSYSITFRIFDEESNKLWEETQSVTLSKGVFSVLLGGTTALNLDFAKPYFLEIQVGTETMSPRQRITSVGYAIRAEEADKAKTADNAQKLNNQDSSYYTNAKNITDVLPVAHGGTGVAANANSANGVVILDNAGKLPVSALKTYDSGWFAVSLGNSYTLDHNLGTTKVLITVQFSQNADGSSPVIGFPGEINSSQVGAVLTNLTSNQITYDARNHPRASAIYWDGYTIYYSGYMRIIMLALG